MGAPHSWGSLGCSAGGLRQCCFFSSRVSHPHSSKTTPTPARSQQLPSRAPAEQTQGIHAIPTPPPHTHTQSRVVSFLQGTRVGFWLPSLRPLLSNSTQLFCGCCSSPPSDHEVPGTHAPGTLGGLVSQQCEPWAGGVFTPRACLASPDWVCRAGTAV